MKIASVTAAAEDLRALVNGDGAELHLVRVDTRRGVVELELDLATAGCEECVMPPDTLLAMVDSGLKRRVPGDYLVVVDDPRRDSPERLPEAGGSDGQLTVVDPSAETSAADTDPGPDAGPLAGKVVGFRVDVLWRSWDWVVDEWITALEIAGVKTVQWRRIQGLAGEEGRIQGDSFEEFLASADVVVSGLGNCGSCTSWTIKDAVAPLSSGLPTVAVVTEHFEPLGRTLAGHYGKGGLRLVVLPYPLDIRPEEEVREIARARLPVLLSALGATV
jgi:Fe-S cluster biogenesis protein NfuA